MNRERLTILRDFLRNMTPEQRAHFNMQCYIGHGRFEDGSPRAERFGLGSGGHIGTPARFGVDPTELTGYPGFYHIKLTEADLLTCGTSACALGWAAVIFAEDGLQIQGTPGAALTVVYRSRRSEDAAALFFDIPVHHAEYLFLDNLFLTPDEVADRIDRLLKEEEVTR